MIKLTSEPKDVSQALSDYFNEATGHQCKFSREDNHPFGLLKKNDIQVYAFEANEQYDDCQYYYINYKEKTDKNLLDLRRSNRTGIFFVYDKKHSSELLEITINYKKIITGPVEQNNSEEVIINWYQTLSRT